VLRLGGGFPDERLEVGGERLEVGGERLEVEGGRFGGGRWGMGYAWGMATRNPRKTKAELVYEALQAAILSGNIKEGEHLRQEEVAARWGVSQTPVREAFRRLESEGLVEHAPNRGVIVRGLPWTPPPAPLDVIRRRWDELVRDPESIPGSDFP
jgi:hypothetical protein